jgi:membrane fusion protein (multidrug efflux system)
MNRFYKWSQAVSVIVLLFVVLDACKGKPETPKPKTAPPTVVDVLIAAPQSIANTVEANGTVVAAEYVELHPEIAGRLTYLNVPEGKRIAQGTVVARINDADLRAQLQKSRVQLQLQEKTLERYKKLLDVSGINQSDYDLVESQVSSLKADMDYTQTLIDKTVIRAPFSGVAGLRQVSPGAFVTTSTVLVTIQQIDKIKIDFTLPESYSNMVRVGATVDVEVDAANKTHKRATIIATEPQVNQSTRNIKVRGILQGGDANPGAFVKVYLNASVDKKAIMVPTNSIIPDDKNNQVILVKDGKAAFVTVQTGIRESNNVEITKGITPGDSVVVSGVLFAKPKAPLKVRGVKTLEQLAKQ